MKLQIERLPGPEAWPAIEAEWETLSAQIFPRTPFSTPLWISKWWRHLRRFRLSLRDEFFCHIARDENGRLVAVAPLMRTHVPGVGPFGIRLVQFFGADPSITEIRGVICRVEDEGAVVEALMAYFHRRVDEWDVLKWKGLRQAACEYSMIFDRCVIDTDRPLPDYVLTLPQSWETLRSSVSADMRKNLRKAREFLERDGHAFVFRVVDQTGDVSAALDRFFTLHAARAAATDMSNDHPNRFLSASSRNFLIDYVGQVAQMGQLRLLELEVDGDVVASRLAFTFGSDLYMYFSGYEPSWRKYSVMTLLMSEAMTWAIGQKLQRVNLSTGNDQSKLRWRPSEILFHDAIQIAPTLRARLSVPVYEALARRLRRQ